MKNQLKKIATIVICFGFLGVNAQLEKGNKIIGIGLSTYSDSDDRSLNQISHDRTLNFNGGISGGYFVTNALAIGVGLDYSHYSHNYTTDKPGFYRKSTSNYISPNLFLKYFISIGGQFYFSPMAKLKYTNYKSTSIYKPDAANPEEISPGKGNYMSIIISPFKFGYLIHNKYLVEVSMGNLYYEYRKETSSSGIDNSQIISKTFGIDAPSNFFEASFSIVF